MKKKKNVNKQNESPEEYFVGMLLSASENNLNRIEFADVWYKNKNKYDIFYRTKDFDKSWNLNKAHKMPFRFYDVFDTFIKRAKALMEERGLSVPDVEIKCIDI